MPQLMKTFTQTINGRYIKLMTRTVCAVKANTLPISLLWFWCLHVTTLAECDAIILFMNIQSETGKKGNSACDIRSLWKSTLLRDGKQLERCIRLQATPCSFLPVCVCECVCVSVSWRSAFIQSTYLEWKYTDVLSVWANRHAVCLPSVKYN